MIVSADRQVSLSESFSEIEKFFISFIKQERIDEYKLSLKLNIPQFFVKKIVTNLKIKGAISKMRGSNKLILSEDIKYLDLYEKEGYMDLSMRHECQILFSPEVMEDTLTQIEILYKNCLDYHVLCYFNSALDIAKEIIILIKEKLIINFYEIFYPPDIDFLNLVEKIHYSGQSSELGPLIEVLLDFFYKIISFYYG